MKKISFFAAILLMIGSAACAQKSDKRGNSKAEMANEIDSVSYVFGASLGQNIRQANIDDVNQDMVMQGFLDAMEGDESMKIDMEKGNQIVRSFMMREQEKQAAASLEKADSYMEEQSKNSDYSQTGSGLLYKFIEKGSGDMPTASDKVKVHYEGKTTEGTVFDSSYERGNPAEFPLNRVIPGWTEVLQLMPVGSTLEAVIPPGLAYGERGSPPNIGPNEVLIFKIELIDILEE